MLGWVWLYDLAIQCTLGFTPQGNSGRAEAGLQVGDSRSCPYGYTAPYRGEKNSPLVRAFLNAVRATGGNTSLSVGFLRLRSARVAEHPEA